MTDSTPRRPTPDPDSIDRPESRRATHNIPPLVWIILAILVAVIAIAAVQRDGSHQTPQGGSMPQTDDPGSYMPAAPATGDAPATPGGTVTRRAD